MLYYLRNFFVRVRHDFSQVTEKQIVILVKKPMDVVSYLAGIVKKAELLFIKVKVNTLRIHQKMCLLKVLYVQIGKS